jgi:hypothetical protein
MIRLIVKIADNGAAINLGEDVEKSYKTFDCKLPELEAFILDAQDIKYETRTIIGAEIIKEQQ